MQLNRKEVATLSLALKAARDLSHLSSDGFTIEVRRVLAQAELALARARRAHRAIRLLESSVAGAVAADS